MDFCKFASFADYWGTADYWGRFVSHIRKKRGGDRFDPPPRQPVSKPDVRLNRVKHNVLAWEPSFALTPRCLSKSKPILLITFLWFCRVPQS